MTLGVFVALWIRSLRLRRTLRVNDASRVWGTPCLATVKWPPKRRGRNDKPKGARQARIDMFRQACCAYAPGCRRSQKKHLAARRPQTLVPHGSEAGLVAHMGQAQGSVPRRLQERGESLQHGTDVATYRARSAGQCVTTRALNSKKNSRLHVESIGITTK